MKVVKKKETTPSYICRNTEVLGEHWHRNYITCTFTCKYFYVASNKNVINCTEFPQVSAPEYGYLYQENGLLRDFHFGRSFGDICWPRTTV